MRASEIDPTDAAVFDHWLTLVNTARHDLWPDQPGWQRAELLAATTKVGGPLRTVPLAAYAGDDEMVGTAWLELSQVDNRHLGFVELNVPSAHGRRGAGSALLAEAERLVRADGRTVLAGYQEEPSRWEGRSPGRSFARHHGYQAVQATARRDLALPPTEGALEALGARCRRDDGYDLSTWDGPWPAEYLEDRVEFGRRMSTDPPLGEFEFHEEHWDEDRVRASEQLIADQDRTKIVTVARHVASGRLVSFTEVLVPNGAPELAYQHDTLVLGEHRGHRLGLRVKLANLVAVMARSPATRTVTTWNAQDNRWMIAVNEALGCELAATAITWQKRFG